MSALKAFEAFRKGNTDYLFVMDEYGGFSGILSIRDLIEEIVGELSAVAAEEDEITPQEDGTWIAGGSVNIDDAIRVLELDSLGGGDHPDYHTLAGFILSIAEEIPHPGARFIYKTFEFKILDMDGNRIDRVQITRKSEEGGVEEVRS
jgi:putative hemolysin